MLFRFLHFTQAFSTFLLVQFSFVIFKCHFFILLDLVSESSNLLLLPISSDLFLPVALSELPAVLFCFFFIPAHPQMIFPSLALSLVVAIIYLSFQSNFPFRFCISIRVPWENSNFITDQIRSQQKLVRSMMLHLFDRHNFPTFWVSTLIFSLLISKRL